VKLFGAVPSWREGWTAERAAYAALAPDPEIAAPRLLAHGRLADDARASWPYLVTTRMPGTAWAGAGLSAGQRRSVAADLGRQARRVHALRPSSAVPRVDVRALAVPAAARRSSLPAHLVAQVEDYVGRVARRSPPPAEAVFVHADLTTMHVFVDGAHLAGIIDWGDAVVIDRHGELGQLHRDVFRCDKALLRAFLDAYDWPVAADFARQALLFALYRQTLGLLQHPTIDLFEPIAELFPLQDIATLDELAADLFGL
jgi:aminoglycoside phosphotransferase